MRIRTFRAGHKSFVGSSGHTQRCSESCQHLGHRLAHAAALSRAGGRARRPCSEPLPSPTCLPKSTDACPRGPPSTTRRVPTARRAFPLVNQVPRRAPLTSLTQSDGWCAQFAVATLGATCWFGVTPSATLAYPPATTSWCPGLLDFRGPDFQDLVLISSADFQSALLR